MKLNQGDFGSISIENDQFYFRFRSFVSLKTGKVLDKRTPQKSLLGTRDGSIYKDLKSSALHIKADELRKRIIALEQAAHTGQTVTGDDTAAPPVAPDGEITITEFFEKIFIPAKRALRDSGKLATITFTTYLRYWNAKGYGLKHHFNSQLTFKTYRSWMGQRFLERLRKEDGTSYGQNTVNKIHSVASAIFTEAIEKGYLDNNEPPRHNPFNDIKRAKLPTVCAEQGVAFTEAEVFAISRNIELELGQNDVRDANIRNAQVALALGFFAGLRPSEIVALRWENVDVARGTIKVCESVVEKVHAKRTKTSENRVITVLEPLIPILTAWHKAAGSPKSGLVLHAKDDTGKHVNLGDLSETIITPNCEQHGLERWKGTAWYGLRRGCGTLLVHLGCTPVQVAKFLGNTIAVVEKHYFVDKGEMAAQAADVYRQRKLAQAAEGLTEQKKLRGELAALGLSDGGAL
jgi:integrase